MSNSVFLIGRIIDTPEIINNNIRKILKFQIETTEIWQKDNQMREKSDTHSIIVYNNKIIDALLDQLQADRTVLIEGKVKYETSADNVKKSFISVDIVGGDIKIIDANKYNHLNKVFLIGRVGSDPELLKTSDDKKIAKFSLATSEKWRDKITNENKEKTEWHKIVVYNTKLIEIIEKFVKKGTLLFINGKIKTESWVDANGQNKSNVIIVLDLVNAVLKILNSKESNTNTNKSLNIDTSDFSDFEGIDF